MDEQAIVKFQEFSPAKIEGMVKDYIALTVPAEDSKAYKTARAALTTCVTTRTSIDKRRKELGEDARKWINQVNDTAKQLTALLEPAEKHLRTELDREDARKEAVRAEKERIERERIEGIRNKIAVIQNMTTNLNGLSSQQLESVIMQLQSMPITIEEYQDLMVEADQVKQTAIAAVQDAFQNRVVWEKEQEARKAEQERLAWAREAQRLENERLAKQRAELEAAIEAQRKATEAAEAELKKKQEESDRKIKQELEAAEKKIREEQDRIAKEQAKLEADRQAEAKRRQDEKDARVKAEADRLAKEAMEKAKAEEEAERKAREEALKPDKEKLMEWLDKIQLPDYKTSILLQTPEASVFLDSFLKSFDSIINDAKERVVRL